MQWEAGTICGLSFFTVSQVDCFLFFGCAVLFYLAFSDFIFTSQGLATLIVVAHWEALDQMGLLLFHRLIIVSLLYFIITQVG